ncbi:hypothetical protein PF006_g28789 [Phytophthora fragariae]|uniref:Uncharacterized protein n=1 Tax=Phytophthora fragariae TaxID=53985 RepID=A0A6A3QBN8_9STRA|nr:hypothetical protein PF006_g28789 [Phytophthora fragariae]
MVSERPLTSMTPGSETADRNSSSSVDVPADPHGHRVTGGDGVLQGLHAQRMRIMIDEGNEYGGLEVGQGRLDAEPQALGEPTKDGKHPEVETTATLLLLLISFAVAALVLPMFLLFDSLYRHIKRINFFT